MPLQWDQAAAKLIVHTADVSPQQWWVTGRYRLKAQVQAAAGCHVLPPACCQGGAVLRKQRRVCTQVQEVDVAEAHATSRWQRRQPAANLWYVRHIFNKMIKTDFTTSFIICW